ncbi:MAG: hemin uptake protein HemP [Pseudomonadota bacterium]
MTTLTTPTEAGGLPPLGTPIPASLAVPMPPVAAAPRWRSEELLAGTDEALISHGDQVYRLRRTGTGKLILTK